MEREELTEFEEKFVKERLVTQKDAFYKAGDIVYIIDQTKCVIRKAKVLSAFVAKKNYSNFSLTNTCLIRFLDTPDNSYAYDIKVFEECELYPSLEKAQKDLARNLRYKIANSLCNSIDRNKNLLKILKNYKYIENNITSEYFKKLYIEVIRTIRSNQAAYLKLLQELENPEEVNKLFRED